MSNLTLIPILPGINDLPQVLEDGPNGALVTEKVNQLLSIAAKPTEVWDETDSINFYLDTVDGVDTNNGLTKLTPFKTWEKIKDTLKVKLIGNQKKIYIYIKGVLQAPLDFSGIYGLSADPQRPGYIKFYGWDDANGDVTPYKLQGVTSAVLDKRAFINLDSSLKIHVSNAVVDIPDRIVFSGSNVYFENITWQMHDTTAPYYVSGNNDAVIFVDGFYETQNSHCMVGYRYGKMTFANNTVNKISGSWTFDADSNNYTAFNFVGNSVTQFTPVNSSGPDVIRSLRQESPAKVYAIINDPQWYYSGDEIPMNVSQYLPLIGLADTDLIQVVSGSSSSVIQFATLKNLLGSGNSGNGSPILMRESLWVPADVAKTGANWYFNVFAPTEIVTIKRVLVTLPANSLAFQGWLNSDFDVQVTVSNGTKLPDNAGNPGDHHDFIGTPVAIFVYTNYGRVGLAVNQGWVATVHFTGTGNDFPIYATTEYYLGDVN